MLLSLAPSKEKGAICSVGCKQKKYLNEISAFAFYISSSHLNTHTRKPDNMANGKNRFARSHCRSYLIYTTYTE